MMITYPGLTKLRTKQVVYQDVVLASDSGTLEQLKELSSKRKAIEETINESSFVTEAIAREMSGGLTSRCQQDIQKLESYLPLLENLIHHINLNEKNRQVVYWVSELKIRWSSVLSPSSIFYFQGPKLYMVNSIYFELGMMLFLYGALLREQALEVISTDLVQAATLFRKAAGVYKYLAEDVLVNLHSTHEKPPEATTAVCSTMSLICLADAQAVTARKAEENGNRGGLLAKLHCGVKDFMVEAINILQTSTKECKDTSHHLLEFVLGCKTLHELLSCKHFVEGLKSEGEIGLAIGILRRGIENGSRSTPKEESWRLVCQKVVDELTALLQKYEHENEFVWHEKVPFDDEFPSPPSTRIVTLITYQPPKWERTLIFKL